MVNTFFGLFFTKNDDKANHNYTKSQNYLY